MKKAEQIKKCQRNTRGYIEFFTWADKQEARGHRQKRCRSCKKFKYPDERCKLFRAEKEIKRGLKKTCLA